jgi:hypothetical protein
MSRRSWRLWLSPKASPSEEWCGASSRQAPLHLRGHGRAKRQEHWATGSGLCVAPKSLDGVPAAGAWSHATPRLSLVVLPCANLSNDSEQQYFADGITEDLTTDLSRIADMLVVSRNTAFTYQGERVDTKQIGRELNVRYVLESSVRRSGCGPTDCRAPMMIARTSVESRIPERVIRLAHGLRPSRLSSSLRSPAARLAFRRWW